MFKKILIANRGEIACRVIKTARKMGIKTVAVYSDADRDALHVEMADEAVHIGPPPAAQSYLLIDKIIDACKQTGAEAVHPGYGFLSEREAFPIALEKAGIVFIGPNPKAIAAMGDKIESKKAAAARQGLDRPRLRGRDRRRQARRQDRRRDRLSGHDQGLRRRRRQGHAHRLQREGGRGRLPARALRGQVVSFGDDRMFIEKFIVNPRHIEIQLHRRQARQRHLSRRARVLDPAPQSEGPRGSAVAAAR